MFSLSRRRGLVALSGITAAGATVAALGISGVAHGSTPSPTGPGRPASHGVPAPPDPGTGPRPAAPAGPGSGGRVTAVTATSVTVRDDLGRSTTYTLTSATTYTQGPKKSLRRSDISTGDRVTVRPTSPGGTTAAAIDEHLPHLDGLVAAVDGSTITVTDDDGFTRTISTSGTTKYTKGGATSSAAAVTTGTPIHAEGRVDTNGTSLDATTVDIRTDAPPPSAKGNAPRSTAAPTGTAGPSAPASPTGS